MRRTITHEKENSYYSRDSGSSGSCSRCVVLSSAGKVDQEILSRLEGDYGIPYDDDMDDEEYYDNECFWEMAVFTKADGFFTTKPPALMIYDAEAGEPGLAGTIINLDADTMELKIDDRMTDKDYYPSGWDIETSSDTIEFTYEETEDGLELTNHGKRSLL